MNLADTPLKAFGARAGERIWRGLDRRFALVLLCLLPIIAAVRVSQKSSPLSDPMMLALVLLWLSSAHEYWSLVRRQVRSVSGVFMPVICSITVVVSQLTVHPSTVIWVPMAMFFCFVRLPVWPAQALSLGVCVASLAILKFHWQVDAYWLERTVFTLTVSLLAITLFFRSVSETLQELGRTAELFDSSVQAMAQGIIIAGPDGRVQIYNEQAREMLNLPQAMMRDHPRMADLRALRKGNADLDGVGDVVVSDDNGGAPGPGAADSMHQRRSHTRRTPEGRYLLVEAINTVSGNAIRTYTDVTSYELVNRQLNAVLQDYGEMRRRELNRTREQLIAALSLLSLHRDDATGEHIVRTQLYLRTLATALAQSGHWASALDAHSIDMIVMASPMHDLGKIGIPDHILKKRGRLSPGEIAIMHTHASIGESTLETAAAGSVEDRSLLLLAARMAGAHHENWDGSGYPKGLAGEQIPLEARLMALADVYDALTTPRAYKPAWSHEVATAEIRRLRGVKFDPAIVDAFEREEAVFRSIAQSLREPIDGAIAT